MYYLAIISREADGFGFVIPDIPGFTAHAETASLDAAMKVARNVLAGHLAAMADSGLDLPTPRDPADVRADDVFAQDFDEALTTILLPALLPAGRTRRVNVTLDENTLDLIDRSAADRNLTRSAFIAEAARSFASA